jgi:ATP-binding cassette subfamily B protein
MRIFIKAPVATIGSIILATSINARLSFIIYGVVLILFLLIYLAMRLSYERFTRLQKAMDKMNSRVEEYLLSIRLVKAFGTYDNEQVKFEHDNQQLQTSSLAAQMVVTVLSPLLSLIVGFGTLGILLLGSKLFSLSLVNAGDISAFSVYIALMLGSILQMTNIFNILIRTKASCFFPSGFFLRGRRRSQGAAGYLLLCAAGAKPCHHRSHRSRKIHHRGLAA